MPRITAIAVEPNKLMDVLLSKGNLKNDAALARKLEVASPVISKIRHGKLPVGATMRIKIHETFDMSFADISFHIAASA